MIRATLTIIEEEGLAALSVRAAAKRAGVSAGAPFRHFASRKALLTAVAREATDALHRDVAAAVADARGAKPIDRLKAIAAAYLDWALANPARFETISDRRLIDYDGSPELKARNDQTRALLDDAIGAALATRGRAASAREIEIVRVGLRALGYGLARMFVDGHFSDWSLAGATPRQTVRRVVEDFIERAATAKG